MASSRFLISSTTLTSTQANVDFSSIPATYTDLVLKISARGSTSGNTSSDLYFRINGLSTSIYSRTSINGNGSAASSDRASNTSAIYNLDMLPGGSVTASTFDSVEIYIPSYTASQNKPVGAFGALENNSTTGYLTGNAGLISSTATITQITIYPGSGSFVSGSSFYLYGIKNS
jgi:hypothetical protein